ncbi:MAG TPA: hypothetical protein VMO88_15640 [Acidimicrobiales bacterium]|nr:hypothetical protein [Acidimicrobiales bacterium]
MVEARIREALRRRAVEAWDDTKRLHHETARVIVEAQHGVQSSQQARAQRSSTPSPSSGAEDLRPIWAGHFSLSITAREVEYLADRAIRKSKTAIEDREAADGGAGLVASAHQSTLARLESLVGERTGFLATARDAGTALGLVISTQPDVAVVDSRLGVANGADLVLTVPFYAPRTRVLLLADDDVAAVAQAAGIEVLSSRFSDEALQCWVAEWAA